MMASGVRDFHMPLNPNASSTTIAPDCIPRLYASVPLSWKGTLVQYAGRLRRLHECKRKARRQVEKILNGRTHRREGRQQRRYIGQQIFDQVQQLPAVARCKVGRPRVDVGAVLPALVGARSGI